MPRSARKKHRLPRKSEEKRSAKYPHTFGLDFSLPIGDRDDDESISRYEEHYNKQEKNDE